MRDWLRRWLDVPASADRGTLTLLPGKVVLGTPKDTNAQTRQYAQQIVDDWLYAQDADAPRVLVLPFPVDVVDQRLGH